LLIVINLDEAELTGQGARATDLREAASRAGLTEFLSHAGTAAAAVCAKIELEIAELEPADAASFLADLGLTESGLDRVIRASYDLLGYISFFTLALYVSGLILLPSTPQTEADSAETARQIILAIKQLSPSARRSIQEAIVREVEPRVESLATQLPPSPDAAQEAHAADVEQPTRLD
jgi:ribosome-binding ATPase YchF (GTP1/OBG family)